VLQVSHAAHQAASELLDEKHQRTVSSPIMSDNGSLDGWQKGPHWFNFSGPVNGGEQPMSHPLSPGRTTMELGVATEKTAGRPRKAKSLAGGAEIEQSRHEANPSQIRSVFELLNIPNRGFASDPGTSGPLAEATVQEEINQPTNNTLVTNPSGVFVEALTASRQSSDAAASQDAVKVMPSTLCSRHEFMWSDVAQVSKHTRTKPFIARSYDPPQWVSYVVKRS
jgi:hypothetical protein